MLGTSGIRGRYGDIITPRLIYEVANKYAQTTNRIYIGKDIRDSSPALYYAAVAGALSAGNKVYLLDTTSTGIVGFSGDGLMITASHNPEEDNGIKFFRDYREITKEEGEFLNRDVIDNQTGVLVDGYRNHIYEKYLNRLDEMFDYDFTIEPIDLNSSAYTFFEYYVETTRHRIKLIDNTPYFLRKSEPIQENVRIERGFMMDGDGDRVVLVKNGRIVDGDRMFAGMAKYLHETRGTKILVVTVECPVAIKRYLSEYYNIQVTPVGSNYISKILASYRDAGFGGEPNGHYIIPKFNLSSDGIAGMALITEMLKNKYELPDINYSVIRRKYPVKDRSKAIQNIKDMIRDEYIDIDGILIERDDMKVLIRPSGTESLIRLTIEAPQDRILEILNRYERLILDSIKN
ncbi:MAG: hypothetical protein NZ908_01645 [Candidatus Micrarchaeota archaeon]|nr:hypothetical protein [Candidatus Micrarchaeota archaeon]MCX8154592.1 hypothetical protein [Candidatus Micrarchaeota archaeon]